MTSLADRTISALRTEHDAAAALVTTLTDDQLTGASGASEWTVAQVLSHMGSGSEITLAGLQAAKGQRDAPGDDFNPSVWARWDAMGPAEQRAEFLEHDAVLVEALEALDAEQRESLRVSVGFLPQPLSIAFFGGMRLNETAAHGWDVRVALQPDAGLLADSADVLADQYCGDLGMLLGFIAKADKLAEPALVAIGDSGYAISIEESVSFAPGADGATATFVGPLEAGIRLLTGRLGERYTAVDVRVEGTVTLEQLRDVFSGF